MRTSSFTPISSLAIAALALSSFGAPRARASEETEIQQLKSEIQLLEQKLNALEAREQAHDQAQQAAVAAAPVAVASAPAPKPSATIKIDDTGFTFASADGSDFIKLHGLVQADSRWFFGDSNLPNNNTFLIRRARLIFEGAFNKDVSFLIVPEFGGGGSGTSNAPVLYDAAVGLALGNWVQVKAGKFKSPLGLEMLQNDAVLLFAERSLATQLVPARDVGVQVGGGSADGVVTYAAGVFNGAPDATYANNVDVDNNKELAGRVFLHPFAAAKDSALAGLGLGIAGSRGLENKSGILTSGYKTDGQQTFFSYRSTVLPDGANWRVAPQANFYAGPFEAEAEYTVSAVNVTNGTTKLELQNRAGQAAAGYVLTGENASYNGLTPAHPFTAGGPGWGAFEVGARLAQLEVDSKAFPTFSDPAASADRATVVAFGLNWYLSRAVRASIDLSQTRFDHPSAVATYSNLVIREDERAVVTRLQVGF